MTDNLKTRIEATIEQMGKLYICHKSNQVKRKTSMPTTLTLKQQWEMLKRHG